MDDAETSTEEDSCQTSLDSCNSDCTDTCEEECIYYYYYAFDSCYDNGEYFVDISCEDRADNVVTDNVSITMADTTVPVITSMSPTGIVSTTVFTLSVYTNEPAICKYDTTDVVYESMANTLSGSSKSHTKDISVSGQGTYTYYSRCKDENNNTMSFSNSTTFNVTTSASTKSSHELGTISSTSTVTISNGNIPVTRLDLAVSEEETNAKVDLELLSSKPSSVSQPKKSVYKYIKIDKTNMDSLSSADIVFKVPKSWISANSVSEDDITLLRYESDWTELSTKKISADSSSVTYSAASPGFSYFAISIKESAVKTTDDSSSDQTTNTATGDDAKEPTEETPEEIIEDASQKSNLLWYIIGGALLLGVIGGSFVFIKKGKSKKNIPIEKTEDLSETQKLIKENMEKGASKDEIIEIFVKNGWKKEDIEKVVDEIKVEESKQVKETVVEEKEVSDSVETNDLSTFVETAKSQGLSDEQIAQMLTEQGWSEEDILTAMSNIKSNEVTVKEEPTVKSDELTPFISQAISSGLSKDEVLSMLKEQGWAEEKIVNALSSFEEPVQKESDSKDSLKEFITQAVASGMSDHDIAENLMKSGWAEEEILEAIRGHK